MDAKEFRKLLRSLRVPAPTVTGDALTFFWTKRGGHAGAKTLDRVRQAAYEAGFQQWDGQNTSNADGSRVGHDGTYTRTQKDVTLVLSASYGVTASENRFSIRVTVQA